MLSKSNPAPINPSKKPDREQLLSQIDLLARQNAELKDLVNKLSQKNSALEQLNSELDAKLNHYEEQLKISLQKRYGSSSEKVYPDQLSLFNEAEDSSNPKVPEPELETIIYKRQKKAKAGKQDLLDNLPVEEIDYKLGEDELNCPACQQELHKMSVQTRQEIKVIPAQVVLVKHNQYIYSCRNCERNGEGVPVTKARMPQPVLAKSLASPGLLAYIMDQKYTNSMPLYRQQKQLERFGVHLSRQTMSNWLIAAAEKWLDLIYTRLHQLLLLRDCIAADETRVQVLNEPGRKAQTQSYMWLYRSNGRDGPPIALFEYQMTRSGQHAKNFLEGFTGQYLAVDAYSGYKQVPDVTLAYCAAHARRNFTDCYKSLSEKAKQNKNLAVLKGIDFYNQLYKIEKRLKHLSDKERYEARLLQSKPVLDEFHQWLIEMQTNVPPKSLLGKAINYCLNQWQGLNAYLLDGRLEIDNSLSERTIRNFVIGRKNWLFTNTPKGARSSAIIYSIIETAKENNLKPMQYLTWLFKQMPNIDITDVNVLDHFLPWSDQLPQECKMQSNKV